MSDSTYEVIFRPQPVHNCSPIAGEYPVGTELKCLACGKVRRLMAQGADKWWGLVVPPKDAPAVER
jgi:hypothetical protein